MKYGFAILTMVLAGHMAWANQDQKRYVPGEFLVEIESSSVDEVLQSLELRGAQIKSQVTENTYTIVLPVGQERGVSIAQDTQRLLQALSRTPGIAIAEPNYIWRLNLRPNDSQYTRLWGLNNSSMPGVDIGAEAAWTKTTGSNKVVVAVIDTGVDYRHPELAPNMWINVVEKNGRPNFDDDGNGVKDDVFGYNFVSTSPSRDPWDDNSHGTHCAGTIGAKGNNGSGIVGVNWTVSIMALKFLDKDGSGSNDDAIRAIDYARKMGANIMSNSWGGPDNSAILGKAIERARNAGILFVAAAGNESSNNDKAASFPANYPYDNVVSVASIDRDGTLSSFSNYGAKKVHVAAPGAEIYSTIPNGKYASYDGTSMATPHVAGIAALLLAYKPNQTYLDIKNSLISTSLKLSSLKGKTVSGGLVNASKAMGN